MIDCGGGVNALPWAVMRWAFRLGGRDKSRPYVTDDYSRYCPGTFGKRALPAINSEHAGKMPAYPGGRDKSRPYVTDDYSRYVPFGTSEGGLNIMKEYLEKMSAERCFDLEIQNTMNLAGAFENDYTTNLKNLFTARFCRIPNETELNNIDGKKAAAWFVQNYRDEITDCCYKKRYKKRKGISFDEILCFLPDDLMIYLNHNEAIFYYRKTEAALVDKIVGEIRKFKAKRIRKKPEIELLVNYGNGLCAQTMKISSPKFSIEENYNDDFLPVHETILNRLSKKNDKGLVLLHGKPGTGKTSYIRHLITKTSKPVIFLPPNMAGSITDPGLMSVLIDRPNSVFVIEDAENIIIDRNSDGSSPVSALLNLADGLLSDCLNIQIICSFNTDLSRVDSALTRKGRLIAKYEFLELDAVKAQALSNKLGFTSVIASPMTLAALYNQDEKEYVAPTEKKAMGFNAAA